MYTHFQLLKKYIHYYVTAANGKGHGMHSPFVYDFIQNVINNHRHFVAPKEIETRRKDLLKDNRVLIVEDLGAGSRVLKAAEKKVGQIAKAQVKSKKYGQLLYRFVKHYQPETVIEMGTSLGVTTAYLASANPNAKIISIEGSKEIAAVAAESFQKLQLKNIQLKTGNFDDVLPFLLKELPSVDVVYIDGNHRLKPTIRYFELLLDKCGNDSILIFDDIHWSKEMEDAWCSIQQHPQVRCTVDIFFLGFVFFRSEFKEKQQFTIRF